MQLELTQPTFPNIFYNIDVWCFRINEPLSDYKKYIYDDKPPNLITFS